MGSKYSQNNKDEIKPKKIFNIVKDYSIETEELSLSNQTKENTDNSSITMNSEIYDNRNKYIYYKFEWIGEGKNVLLSGDFSDNWKTKIYMKKNEETGIFEVILPLERKKFNFKFIIDGDWVCSKQYQTTYDNHNNLNNFIDLTNFNKNAIKKEKNQNNINSITCNNQETNNSFSTYKKEEKNKRYYDCKYPLNNELNIVAPIIMTHYIYSFNIDYQSNQDFISENPSKDFLQYKEKNFNTENNTYKKIMIWPHIKLLHSCSNLEDIKNKEKNYFRICVTNRNKHKFLTIIYYKPK